MNNQYPIIMLYFNKIFLYRANFISKLLFIPNLSIYLLQSYYMDPPSYIALFIENMATQQYIVKRKYYDNEVPSSGSQNT